MMLAKLLLSLGATVAGGAVAAKLGGFDQDDLFEALGLERRESHVFGNLGLIGLGTLVGAGAALLIAPKAGAQTRAWLAREFGKLGDAAEEAVHGLGEEARELIPHLSGLGENERSRANATDGS